MPTRAELIIIVQQLRQAPTRFAPFEVAERVQHAIVRLEQFVIGDALPDNAEAILSEAKGLVAYCASLVPKT